MAIDNIDYGVIAKFLRDPLGDCTGVFIPKSLRDPFGDCTGVFIPKLLRDPFGDCTGVFIPKLLRDPFGDCTGVFIPKLLRDPDCVGDFIPISFRDPFGDCAGVVNGVCFGVPLLELAVLLILLTLSLSDMYEYDDSFFSLAELYIDWIFHSNRILPGRKYLKGWGKKIKK